MAREYNGTLLLRLPLGLAKSDPNCKVVVFPGDHTATILAYHTTLKPASFRDKGEHIAINAATGALVEMFLYWLVLVAYCREHTTLHTWTQLTPLDKFRNPIKTFFTRISQGDLTNHHCLYIKQLKY